MRKSRLTIVLSGLILICSSVLLVAAPAAAFSAYGAGTSGNPFRIATCAQLEEISNNLTAYYVLVSNIDCAGIPSFTHLGDNANFTGTLDGQEHSISNINIDNFALFYQTNGATIENLNLASGSVNGASGTASFVVTATNTTLSNIHSALTVNGSAGLVGYMYGTSSLSQSSFSGTLNGSTSSAYEGGLVSELWNSTVLVTDSFATGSMSDGGAYGGGAVGGPFSGTIRRVYSAINLNITNKGYAGGLTGRTQIPVQDSFSASTITNPGTGAGGFVGNDNGGTYTDDFYDKALSGNLTCGNGSGSCTAENVGNASPTYFQNSISNGPLGTWDFNNVWQTTSGYPTLRDLAGFNAPTTPNNGDANGDGIADSYQANVASIKDASGVWSTVTIPSSSNCTLDSPASVDANAIKADSRSATVKYDAFTVYCPTAGATVPVTIIYDKIYNTTGAILRYYNPTSKVYSTVSGATFGTTTVGGVTKTTVTYNVTDGGSWDNDGASNGVIVDPVAMITTTVGAPDTGLGAPASPWLETLAFAMLAAGALSLAWNGRKNIHH